MNNKSILIGTFVKKHKILGFLEFLKNKLSLDLDRVFVYVITDNNDEYLVTFRSTRQNRYSYRIYDSTIMHVKNGCLFSINALNALIEKEKEGEQDNKDYQLDWSKYHNKLLVVTNDELQIKDIEKVEDKSVFFKS